MQHPIPDASVLDVHKLGADRACVDVFQRGDHLAQRHLPVAEKEFRRNVKIKILFTESEFAEGQEWIFSPPVRQRVKACNRVPERAVGVNESVHPRLQRTLATFGSSCNRAISFRQFSQLEALEECSPS